MGNADVATIDTFVAVDGHEPLAVKSAEEHAVTEVGGSDGFGLLKPRTIEGAALGIGDTLGVDVIHPACPYHAETTCASAEKVRTIGDFVGAHLAVLHFPALWGCGGTEEDGALSDGTAEVGLDRKSVV